VEPFCFTDSGNWRATEALATRLVYGIPQIFRYFGYFDFSLFTVSGYGTAEIHRIRQYSLPWTKHHGIQPKQRSIYGNRETVI